MRSARTRSVRGIVGVVVATLTAAGGQLAVVPANAADAVPAVQFADGAAPLEAESSANVASGGATFTNRCLYCTGPGAVGGLTGTGSLSMRIAFPRVWNALAIRYVNSGAEDVSATVTRDGRAQTVRFAPTAVNRVGTTVISIPGGGAESTVTISGATSAALSIDSVYTHTSAERTVASGYTDTLSGGAVRKSASFTLDGGYVGNIGYGGQLRLSTQLRSVVAIAYVNGDSFSREVLVRVDGGAPQRLVLPSTGDWSSVGVYYWRTGVDDGAPDRAQHTVEFSNPTGWAPDIDVILPVVR